MPDRSLNVGLIGAGRIGRLHAEHLSTRIPDANLVMVADVDEHIARECAQRCRIPEYSVNSRSVIDHPDIQAIVICSPTDTHTPFIESAAAAGKHIFCEKPIATDLERIDRALKAVEQAGVILQVGFNRRFDANAKRVRQAVADAEIGTPHQLHIISRDPAPPSLDYLRKSGGIFMDMTIHDFDMARFLIGCDVEEIYAMGEVRVDPAIREIGDLDTAVVMLKFANGVMGTIENCRQAIYGYDQRIEVFGDGGSIRVDNNFPNAALISGKAGVYRDRPLNFFMDRYSESYLEEIRQFIGAAASGGPSPVPGLEGRIAVVMALAARKSRAENRPVRLAEVA